MKRIYRAFKEILGTIFGTNLLVVLSVFGSAVLTGVITPISVWVNSLIFDRGIMVASGDLPFQSYN
jgi:ATP-binding cassette subfamily B protein